MSRFGAEVSASYFPLFLACASVLLVGGIYNSKLQISELPLSLPGPLQPVSEDSDEVGGAESFGQVAASFL